MIAAGKASAAMARAASEVLGTRLRSGIVITPDAAEMPPRLRVVVAEHPQPGQGSLAAGRGALDVAWGAVPGELLLILLSGGASSLMAYPAAGLTLEEKRATTGVLLTAGADIYELNTVRKHLSAVKGGRLAAASRAECLTLVVSDVVGDDTSVIASGPTVADPSTYRDAWQVLERRGGTAAFPEAVVTHLARGAAGEIPETPKPGDPALQRSHVQIIGSRHVAMRGAAARARQLGYHVEVIDGALVGEAREAAGRHVAQVLDRSAAQPRPRCIVSSGETTVTVRGRGRGGRNQEFVLASVELLARQGGAVALASVGTDGVDGPTDAAGAVADASSLARGEALGVVPAPFLAGNDAYHYFDRLGDLVRTGPTGTNVGDLQVILLA